MLWGVVGAAYMVDTSLTYWTPPPVWGASPYVLHPHSLVGFPVHLYALGISACDMENFPHMLGVWQVFAHMLQVCHYHWLSICFILYLLVVHYVSCIYHRYDYYCSGYGSVFWAVICFISDCGSFPDGAYCNIGQHEVVLPPPLMPIDSGGVSGLASVPQQQPPSLMPLLAYANYAMGSPQVGFFFRVEPPTIFYIICLVSNLLSAFYFQVPGWMLYSSMGALPLGFAPLQPFGVYPRQAYVQPGDGHWSMLGMHRVAAPSATFSWGSLLLLSLLFPSHPIYKVGHTALGTRQIHLIPLPFLHGGEGSSFPGLMPLDDMVNSESLMGIKPGDSGVVIGYQVDEFTCTWSAEQFVACSHIYPGFTGKVSSLTHFHLNQGCEDYAFLDQAVADFEQDLNSILIDSLETLELDTSLDEPDVITSSVSSGFLCSVSTLSDNSKPQLAPII